MRILYLGDIMGSPGRDIIAAKLPDLRKKYTPDFVIAQAENVSHGKGLTPAHMRDLQAAGVQCFTGGNHSIERPATWGMLDDPQCPVLAPINQPGSKPEWGAKVVPTPKGDVLVVSVLGTIFPNIEQPMERPLQSVDAVLRQYAERRLAARVINFHGDFSSEKRMIGYYLDGRVSAVIGDHWHVPTADAMVLPSGTAHITDVGMCGTLHSSLGVTKEIIINRWLTGIKNKNEIAIGGPHQINAVIVDVNAKGLAKHIQAINERLD